MMPPSRPSVDPPAVLRTFGAASRGSEGPTSLSPRFPGLLTSSLGAMSAIPGTGRAQAGQNREGGGKGRISRF